MATYHVMAVPKAGQNPSPDRCPLYPRDITADNDAAALEFAGSLIAEAVGEYREVFEFLVESEEAADTNAESDEGAAEFRAAATQWQPTARRVDRPAVAIIPRSWTTDFGEDGKGVGQQCHYGDEMGEWAFDVLVGGTVAGLLAEGRRWVPVPTEAEKHQEIRTWCLREATGALAPLRGRTWDHGPHGATQGLHAALAAIRAALELAVAASQQPGAAEHDPTPPNFAPLRPKRSSRP